MINGNSNSNKWYMNNMMWKYRVNGQLRCLFIIWICFVYFSQVSVEDGENQAKEYNVMFIETSAKAGYNVKYP